VRRASRVSMSGSPPGAWPAAAAVR
jgi:hypothetical protein